MKPLEIDRMSVAEKLQALEALWEALDDEEIQTPSWHYDVLTERERLIESGQAEYISLDAFKKQR